MTRQTGAGRLMVGGMGAVVAGALLFTAAPGAVQQPDPAADAADSARAAVARADAAARADRAAAAPEEANSQPPLPRGRGLG